VKTNDKVRPVKVAPNTFQREAILGSQYTRKSAAPGAYVTAEERQMEKKVRRLPVSVAPVTVDFEYISNLGPAVPARISRTML
jgi:hypothetical protein